MSDPSPRKSSTAARPAASRVAKRWAAPAMLTCWVLGLLWVVVYYVAGDRIPGIDTLGGWNLVGGMALIAVGFLFATQWE